MTGRRIATLQHLAMSVGALAGAGGFIHGIGEIRQGDTWADSVFVESWTEGRIADNLGGEPGLTLVPHLLTTGVLTMGASVAVIWWALRMLDRRYGGRGLAALSVLMLLVGGGVGPPTMSLLAALAAGAAHRGDRVPRWARGRLGRSLAAAWPALFWLAIADAAYLVIGSVTVGVVLDIDIADSFVAALLLALVVMPLATAAGVADDVARSARPGARRDAAAPGGRGEVP